MMLTNVKRWYNDREILPAIVQSDHLSVLLIRTNQPHLPNTITNTWVRKRKLSNMEAFGRFLSNLNWNSFSKLPSCQVMCDLFYDILFMGLNTFFPKQAVRLHCRDKVWITSDIKLLISHRQQALAMGNTIKYNKLRNEVIHVVKLAKSKYFQSQVNHLKKSKPRKWWSAIKNLAGYSLKSDMPLCSSRL